MPKLHSRKKRLDNLLALSFTAEQARRFLAYDPDQPRVPAGDPDGGQWVGEGGGGGGEGYGRKVTAEEHAKAVQEALADYDGQARIREKLTKIVADLGVPPEKVHLLDEQLSNPNAAAEVVAATGEMNLSTPMLLAEDNLGTKIGAVVAHESEHMKFRDVLLSLNDQLQEMVIDEKVHTTAEYDKLSEDVKDKYPTVKTLIAYDKRAAELIENDGVTPYSKMYYPPKASVKRMLSNPAVVRALEQDWRIQGTQFNTAVHETLAEISFLKAAGRSTDRVAPVWKELHSDVDSLYGGPIKTSPVKLLALDFTADEIRKFRAYDPDQPRVPAGEPDGGQWTDAGGGGGAGASKGTGAGGKGKGISLPSVELNEVNPATDAARFIAARNQSSRARFMTPLEPQDLSEHRLFLSDDEKVGYALSPDNDLQNLFSNSDVKGAGKAALVDAIKNGAETLDCYDGYLTKTYSNFGFVASSRIAFDPQFAPEGWDSDRDLQVKPDVVFMTYQGGERDTIDIRAGSFPLYDKSAIKLYPDYDSAKAAQGRARVAGESGRGGTEGHRKFHSGLGQRLFRGALAGLPRPVRRGAGFLAEFDPDQPRVPAGDPDGGQWTDAGGGGGGGVHPGDVAQPDPRVVNVGGDEWNKATALRLEKEYLAEKPTIEKLADNSVGKKLLESDEYTPQSWEDLSNDSQEQAKENFFESNHNSFLESEIDNWYQSGGALDEAKYALANNDDAKQYDLVHDTLSEIRAAREEAGQKELPYTDDDLYKAISFAYEGDGEGRNDPKIEFDDAKLAKPLNAPPPEQETFPGIEPEVLSNRLTPEMREEIKDALTTAFNAKAESMSSDMQAPDYLEDSVKEYMEMVWDEKSDDDKFDEAVKLGVVTEEEGPHNVEIDRIPSPPDPLQEGLSKDNYVATQKLAKYMSTERALQVMLDRGLLPDLAENMTPEAMGAARANVLSMDNELWEGWKGASNHTKGRLLQVAAADELNGRLRGIDTAMGTSLTADATRNDAIEYANDEYNHLGGYDGVKAYIRGKWETTQYLLDKSDNQVVHVYRSLEPRDLNLPNELQVDVNGYTRLPEAKLQRSGLQSFTTDVDVANRWHRYSPKAVVLRAEIPRTAVLSVPAYGINIYSEHEVVVAGTAWKGWDAWTRAPDFSEVKLQEPYNSKADGSQ